MASLATLPVAQVLAGAGDEEGGYGEGESFDHRGGGGESQLEPDVHLLVSGLGVSPGGHRSHQVGEVGPGSVEGGEDSLEI